MLTCPPSKVSNWCHVIDTGLTTSNGRTVHKVLINIIQTFGSYNLETDKGIHNVIKEIETQIGEVASMEEHSELVKNTQ